MKLKSLKLKSKEFIFTSFGNAESEEPAKIIFYRFPTPDELFPIANQKNVLDSSVVRDFDNTVKGKEKLVEHIIDVMISNITANRVDLNKFFTECVEKIENLEYDGKKIKTVEQIIKQLPEEAFYQIAMEAYLYSKETDVFTADEKKI